MIMIMSSMPSRWLVNEMMRKGTREAGLLTHALATDDIRKPTKDELTEQVSDRGGSLDTSGLPSGEGG